MSNLIPTNIQVPAHLAKRVGQPSALAQSMSGGIGGSEAIPRISLKGARFRIKDGDAETVLPNTHLDVVSQDVDPGCGTGCAGLLLAGWCTPQC
jgi:hypothetical protein